jgi:hypothetical protein
MTMILVEATNPIVNAPTNTGAVARLDAEMPKTHGRLSNASLAVMLRC